MSEYREYERYLKGEIRVDGFQSDWMKKTLADRAKQAEIPKASPVAMVHKPKRTVAQTHAEYMKKRIALALEEGMCSICYTGKAREGKTTCQPCQDKRTAREMKRYNARKAA